MAYNKKKLMPLIKEGFRLDATIAEIAQHAGISHQTLRDWMKADQKLEEELVSLRNIPTYSARRTVVDGLDEWENAFKYLERKKKGEFSPRSDSKTETIVKVHKLTEQEIKEVNSIFGDDEDNS